MSSGNVIIIRGQVTGDLVLEQFDLDGEAEALILHLDKSPLLRKIHPVSGRMNIRTRPAIEDNIVGKLLGEADVIEEHCIDDDNIWVRIGHHQYVARIYQGTEYCIYG